MTENNINNTIIFKQGLPGYENLRNFILTQPSEEYPLFSLNSLEDESVSFLVINPFQFDKNYSFELTPFAKELLQIEAPSALVVFNIINCQKGWEEATINLKAPLIINGANRQGVQVVLEQPYNIRESLKTFLQRAEG